MNIKNIEKYLNIIKEEDIKKYLSKENIVLNDEEYNYLYNKIKENYIDIINNDKDTFDDIKNNINSDSYIKLLNLFNKYKTIIK